MKKNVYQWILIIIFIAWTLIKFTHISSELTQHSESFQLIKIQEKSIINTIRNCPFYGTPHTTKEFSTTSPNMLINRTLVPIESVTYLKPSAKLLITPQGKTYE